MVVACCAACNARPGSPRAWSRRDRVCHRARDFCDWNDDDRDRTRESNTASILPALQPASSAYTGVTAIRHTLCAMQLLVETAKPPRWLSSFKRYGARKQTLTTDRNGSDAVRAENAKIRTSYWLNA